MEPRITLVTLGVSDLERAVAFYRDGLGLATDGIVGTEFEDGAVAFFRLDGGLTLALWPRESMARDARLNPLPPGNVDFCLAHNVASPEAVDAVLGQAQAAGAVIPNPAAERPWGGYSGYFQDPDGHLWEVAWNPDFPV